MIRNVTIRATNSLFTSQQKTTLLQRRNEARHRHTLARTFVIVDIKLIWEGEKDLDRPQHRPAIRRRELRLPNQLLLRAYESHGSVLPKSGLRTVTCVMRVSLGLEQKRGKDNCERIVLLVLGRLHHPDTVLFIALPRLWISSFMPCTVAHP